MDTKTVLIALLAYAAIGIGVATWTTARHAAGRPSWSGFGTSPAVGHASVIALWPITVYKNLTLSA